MSKLQICTSVYKKSLDEVRRLVASIPKDIDIRIDFDGGWTPDYDPFDVIRDEDHPDHTVVVHNQNMGLAKIRNRQLELCYTEYIQWVDADDYLNGNLINKMNFNTDLIVSPIKLTNKKGNFIELRNCKVARLREQTYFVIPSIVFRTEFLKENNLCFDESGHIFEDIIFSTELSMTDHTYQVMDEPYYIYINDTDGSLSHPSKVDRIIESTLYFMKRLKMLGNSSIIYTRLVEEGLRLLSLPNLSDEMRFEVVDLLKPYKFF